MPIQQIAVVSQSKQGMDNSGMKQGGPEGMGERGAVHNIQAERVLGLGAEMVNGSNENLDSSRKGDTIVAVNTLADNPASAGVDTDSVTDTTVSGLGDHTDNEMINNTHVEADTVIIGDTNSDFTSDSTDRQVTDGTECHIQMQGSDTGNTDSCTVACVTQNDKRTNTRSGKTTKKEKLAPIKKKDSSTQETLHPNSPTPISAERCDSSMSNVDVCRICQCDTCEIQKESPLVSPCLCAGSLKFVHQACLQKWIKSSNKMSCELCHFDYQMTRKTKPFREWERLDMTPAERRKVVCSVTFHVIAITCVVWSLYVLIDRTTEEVEAGSLQWPFWTKLIVVAIGFTGGVVFMYVQCKLYLTLCKKWRTYNKVILVSSISETQRDKANHEGILRMTEKQAQLEEERRTNFDVFTIVHEPESF